MSPEITSGAAKRLLQHRGVASGAGGIIIAVALVVKRSDRFPVGTSVGAYPRAARHSEARPSGAAVETHAVDATGTLEFTALTANKPYTLWAEVAGTNHYVDVEESTFVAPGNLRERIAARRAAAGV